MGFMNLLGKAVSQMLSPSEGKAGMQNLSPEEVEKYRQNPEKAWAESLTLEDIEKYERQGLDMSKYKAMREQSLLDKQTAEQNLVQDSINAMDLSKLRPYLDARAADDPFINDVAKFNDMSKKERLKLENAPLVYGRVVQAHTALYRPCNEDIGRTGIVFLFALDREHRFNEEWLAKTADRIMELKESDVEVPSDNKEFITTLRDDESRFCFPLGTSLSEGADAWCAVYALEEPTMLPMSYIPHSRIIPFLLSDPPEKDQFTVPIQLIPPAYYMK